MSQITGISSITGLSSWVNQGAAPSDVTPNAIDWTDNSDSTIQIPTANGPQTISGINTSINLYYQCIYCGDGGTMQYKLNAGSWTTIAELATVSVSNGDTLDWRYVPSSYSGGETIIIEIRNASDGDAIIDSGIQLAYSAP
jgi:hypothetical protein